MSSTGTSALWRAVRSRRLAVCLFGGVAVYALLGTLVPQARSDRAGFERWAGSRPATARIATLAGLDDAYGSPVLLGAAALLAVSTAACAWERTAASLRILRSGGLIDRRRVDRLRSDPDFVVEVSGEVEPDQALVAADGALAALGLSVRRGPALLEAEGGRFGLLGSPLFHWSLAALLLVVGLGRATRAEGLVALPIGSSVVDRHESYGKLTEGPLYGERHSGLTMTATDLVLDYTKGRVDYGASPIVTLRRGDRTVAEGRVYPNHPLRYGSLLVHADDYGLLATIALEDAKGSRMSSEELIVDFSDAADKDTEPVVFALTGGPSSREYQATLRIPADRVEDAVRKALPSDPRAEVTIEPPGSGEPIRTTLRPGKALEFPTGERLRLLSLGYYARIAVADDWSVTPMYVLFGLAVAGLSLALLVPHRKAWVLRVDTETGAELHVSASGRRSGPAFPGKVRGAVSRAAAAEPPAIDIDDSVRSQRVQPPGKEEGGLS